MCNLATYPWQPGVLPPSQISNCSVEVSQNLIPDTKMLIDKWTDGCWRHQFNTQVSYTPAQKYIKISQIIFICISQNLLLCCYAVSKHY